jgi:hypothetical protein
MKWFKPSARYAPLLELLFAFWVFGAGLATGLFAFHTKISTHTVAIQRPPISAKATLAEVNANIVGKPYVSKGQLSELPGFLCSAWTNGAKGHGWILLECVK